MPRDVCSHWYTRILSAVTLLAAPAFVGCGVDHHQEQARSVVQCILDVPADLSYEEVNALMDGVANNPPSDLACDGTLEPGSEVELIARALT